MYHLTFSIHGNPDRNQGEWTEEHTLSANDINALRSLVRQFQADNQIGGGNWGESLLVQDFEGGFLKIGHMSYNGRVWKEKYWNLDSVGTEVFP
jgi:hypothetical protein